MNLPSFHLVGKVFKESAICWIGDNAMRLSAALSLYTLISLAALVDITMRIVETFSSEKDHVSRAIMDEMRVIMGPQVADSLRPALASASHPSGAAFITSSIVLLVSATGMFMELQDAMNDIWGASARSGHEVRQYLFSRLLSLALVIGLEALLLLSVAFSGLMAGVSSHLTQSMSILGLLGNTAAPFAASILFFAILFKVLPAVDLKWKHVWVGALVAAILFTLGRYGLMQYFRYSPPASMFGAAGSLAAVLLWIYYSSFSLFFGAEFTKAWVRNYHHYRPGAKDHCELTDHSARSKPKRRRKKLAR